jgi:xanthine dehydrogenase accessory factor
MHSVSPDIFLSLLRARDAGTPVVLATNLADGTQVLVPGNAAPSALHDAAIAALMRDRSQLTMLGNERWFLHVHAPAHRLLIVGAVHIAQSLAPLAAAIGLAVTVIDPRRGFASCDRFPGTTLNHAWPDEALSTLKPDSRTAVVTLTHDPKLDDPALDLALRGDAFFIGALGSRKTHAARLERLAAAGHDQDRLARIRGPAGLAIGALTAPEIALSILAEIVAVRRGSALAAR